MNRHIGAAFKNLGPAENSGDKIEQLPKRGTGIKEGTARKERGKGVPLPDNERVERHREVLQDSVNSGNILDDFVEIAVDGVTQFRRKGYEKTVLPPATTPIQETPVQKTSKRHLFHL